MSDIVMPRLSDTMEEGVISRWLKHEGDKVSKGDVLAEIETDKTTMDLECYENGVLEQVLIKEGDAAPIGETIAVVGDGSGASKPSAPKKSDGKADKKGDEKVDSAAAEAGDSTTKSASSTDDDKAAEKSAGESGKADEKKTSEQSDSAPAAGSNADQKQPISPLARRLAKERGIDLSTITPTGSGGIIVRRDVENAATASAEKGSAAPAPAADEPQGDEDVEIKLTRIQKITAKRLAESASTVPHFFITNVVDAKKLLDLRVQVNEALADQGVKVSVNDLIVRAAALALEANPRANSSWNDGTIVQHGRINVGFAAASDNGLLVPVIPDANRKGLAAIASEARELVGKARDNKLSLANLEGGTFTVSNLGMFGVDHFTAIINPPQAGILAVGAATETPVARDGELVIRPLIKLTLSSDHRVLDGAVSAQFMKDLVELLENPLRLVL